MKKLPIEAGRRAWLLAALVLFFGVSCAAPGGLAEPGVGSDELRVDVAWRVPLATDRSWEMSPRELGEPVIAPSGDLLVGASNGWVYRILAATGEILWSVPIGGQVDAAGVVANNQVFIGNNESELVSLSWRDGEELWRYSLRGSVESQPAVDQGRVFVTDSDHVLYALDRESGELLWDYQREAPEFFTIFGGGQPLPMGDEVYCGFADGTLVALNAETGALIWEVYLGGESGEFGDINVPLIHRGERMIASSHGGGVYLVEVATGALLWRAPIENVVGLVEEQGRIYGATASGQVFALDSRDGSRLWRFQLPEDVAPMDLSSTGRYLAVPIARGPIYLFDAASGKPALKWGPSTGFQNAPVFDSARGYVLSNQGYLYGFGLAY